MGETYYARNRDAVLERQRLRRCDPEVRERQRQYCQDYYARCREDIIARSRAKRLGLPHLLDAPPAVKSYLSRHDAFARMSITRISSGRYSSRSRWLASRCCVSGTCLHQQMTALQPGNCYQPRKLSSTCWSRTTLLKS